MVQSITPYGCDIQNGFVLPDTTSYSYACKKKTEMVLRGRVEAAFASHLIFITLTYDRKHLPTTFKDVESLPIFSQRKTRKKLYKSDCQKLKYKFFDVPIPETNISYREKFTLGNDFINVPIPGTNISYKDFEVFDGHEWVEFYSRPKSLINNKYRKFEIMSEQDFKNAKFNWVHSGDVQSNFYGLLVPQHLSDFLIFLRDAIRVQYNFKDFHLRYLANGEYGQTKGCTHRPHYHILIFCPSYISDFDFDFFTRSYWDKARILQIDKVSTNDKQATKRITSYVYAHTAKVDDGNQYQNELSPTFRLQSTYGGGVGFQLTKPKLMQTIKDDSLRSLSFSLSEWNGNKSIKFQTLDKDADGKYYEYEVPRFFKDKVLNYNNLDTRSYYESLSNSVVGLCSNFCRFANCFGKFDLLTVFYNVGMCATPLDVLTYFYINNYKFFDKKFGNSKIFSTFAHKFLESLKLSDTVKRNVYRERYVNRKQQKKYNRARRGFEEL